MPTLRLSIVLLTVLTQSLICTAAPATRTFQVLEEARSERGKLLGFVHTDIRGTERRNNGLNRNALLSEDQVNYPTPESGCGPTALLNILIWYEKYGLIPPASRNADPRRYKLDLFRDIDRQLTAVSGDVRTDDIGTTIGHAGMVMDRIMQERTDGRLRMHATSVEAPLTTRHFLDIMPNFRAGYVVVYPKGKDGQLMDLHAVTFIRADRAGTITFGTWGQLYRGRLKVRKGEQWFIPQDPNHLELKVDSLMTFIPFEPLAAHASR